MITAVSINKAWITVLTDKYEEEVTLVDWRRVTSVKRRYSEVSINQDITYFCEDEKEALQLYNSIKELWSECLAKEEERTI